MAGIIRAGRSAVMAAGRGEFFRSFMEGLKRQPARQAPEIRPPNHFRGRPRPGERFPGHGGGTSGHRSKERQVATRNSGSGNEPSYHSSCPSQPKPVFQIKSSCKLNLLERLPFEILIKILSYLDPSSLFSLNHVSRLLHRLSNDDVLWQRIYTYEFGNETWEPKTSEQCAVRKDTADGEDRPASRWKKLFFKSMIGQEMNKWRKNLKHTSPYTGLPRQTEWVLRYMNVSWELTVCDRLGRARKLDRSRAHFFESSVIVHWSGGINLKLNKISSILLHGVRMEPQRSPTTKKPNWRSLMLKLDTETPYLFIGKDRLGENQVAFIMISLHFHKLVERSLLGSPACPYLESLERSHVGDSDPELGLRDYTLHFVLHNTSTEIMSGCFQQLLCRKAPFRRRFLELRVIERTKLSQHRPLSGSIKLPWKEEELEGAVENCCIMSLTLLDEFQKPFWCVSTPIHITRAKRTLSFDYSGHDFEMLYRNPDGEVKMLLVWLEEQKQFFLIGLTIYVPIEKVNKRFNRDY